VLKLHAK
jgi:hypothetical protein